MGANGVWCMMSSQQFTVCLAGHKQILTDRTGGHLQPDNYRPLNAMFEII